MNDLLYSEIPSRILRKKVYPAKEFEITHVLICERHTLLGETVANFKNLQARI